MMNGSRELLFFILLAGLLGGATTFAYSESESTRYATIQETMNRRHATSVLMSQLALGADVQQSTVELKQTSEQLANQLRHQVDARALQKQVSRLAANHHLANFACTIPSFPSRQVSTKATGKFDDFYQFLSDVEQLPLLRLQKLSVSSNAQAGVVASADFAIVGGSNP